MTPVQRAVALRLAALLSKAWRGATEHDAAALLRELLAAPDALKDAEADRDMLRDALAALVAEASATPDAVGKWHALEDARQALAQVGGPNVALSRHARPQED